MMSERRADYTNRELEHYFKDVGERLIRIETQVLKTNGTVADIQKWRERRDGALAVILIIVIPLLSWGLYKISNINEIVQAGVNKELSKYEVLIK